MQSSLPIKPILTNGKIQQKTDRLAGIHPASVPAKRKSRCTHDENLECLPGYRLAGIAYSG